jgi:CCR4-NOT transcription complex subunit 6
MMEFNQLAAANSKDASDMLNRVMTKDNIGIVALLETNEDYSYGPSTDRTRRQLIVSNVHMAWEPEYSDVKLIQTVLLMQFLQKFRQEVDNGYMLAGESLVCLFVCLFVCLTSITKIKISQTWWSSVDNILQ